MARATKETEYYSLLNVTNGNILSGPLHRSNSYFDAEPIVRQRNFKISQFQVEDASILDYFVNDNKIEELHYWSSMGVQEIWVGEDEIDQLYSVLAIACLHNFCSDYTKQACLYGAYLFQKDPNLFISEGFLDRSDSCSKLIKTKKVGKEFLEFLETNQVLSFIKRSGSSPDVDRHFFSIAELDLVKRTRKDIITKFEEVKK